MEQFFAIGQRNSGKTFTIYGDVRHAKYRGIVPRAIGYLFSELEKFRTTNIEFKVSFCQIYNELIYDLLSNDSQELALATDDLGAPCSKFDFNAR